MKTIRIVVLLGVLALVSVACGGSESNRAVPQIDEPASSAPPAVAIVDGDHTDDEAAHEDGDAAHEDGDAAHEDGDAAHEDGEAAHEDGEAAHEDGEAEHSDDYVPSVDAEPSAEFDVALGDIFFETDAVEVAAGQTVRFNLVNVGVIEHEFRLSNGHRIDEHIAAGHEDHGDTGHHDADRDIVVTLGPGASRSIDVTFPTDTALFTEIACLIPGHYEAGMKAPITYQ